MHLWFLFLNIYLNSLYFVGCIIQCGATQREEGEAACAYICEMTHGYENNQFLDLVIFYIQNTFYTCTDLKA